MSETEKLPQTEPAVVGLGGFGLTMLIQQLHHLELCGIGPVIACGLIFGGVVQFVAGFQEHSAGNNFGFAVFTAYGAFWIAYVIIQFLNEWNIYRSSQTDIGFFMIVWTIYTMILWIASLYINGAMSFTFSLLVLGFILLDLAHFGYPAMAKVSAYVFICSALNAWYIMSHSILLEVSGRDILPLGEPWLVLRSTN